MADVIGLVASVIQVAASGVKLSRTLRDYGSAVQGYEKRLKGLDKDIYFTSGIISELGKLLSDRRVQSLVSERSIELAREIVAEFEGMFETIEDIIAGTRADSMGKWKIYFRESKIKLLLSNLDRLKGNLQLLIGVITHASQISTEHPDDPAMISHRIKILELMVEKEEYTLRYLEEKRKYENLMVHVNSNSTLGSVSTVHTDNGTTVAWKSASSCQHFRVELDSTSDEPTGNGHEGKEVATTKADEAKLTAIDEGEGFDNEAERRMDNIARLKSELTQLRDSRGRADNSSKVHQSSSSSVQPTNANARGVDKITTSLIGMEVPTNNRELSPQDNRRQMRALETRDRVNSKSERQLKRDVVSKLCKKALKGTGYVIGGTFVLVLFPITLPLWRWQRKGRSHRGSGMSVEHYAPPVMPTSVDSYYSSGVSRPQPVQFSARLELSPSPQQVQLGYNVRPPQAEPMPQVPVPACQNVRFAQAYPQQQQQQHLIQTYQQQRLYGATSPMAYYGQHSQQQQMMAELPGPYELGDRPEVGLLHELTMVGGRRL